MSLLQEFNCFNLIVPVKKDMTNSKNLYKLFHIRQFYASVIQHGYGLVLEIDKHVLET